MNLPRLTALLEALWPLLAWALIAYFLIRWLFRYWESRLAAQQSYSLKFPLSPMVFLSRKLVIEGLVQDPEIQTAIAERAAATGHGVDQVEKLVRRQASEIVPAFKAVFYFSIGYFLARLLLLTLYRVKLARNAPDEYAKIGRDATVVLFMNHRSNMDVLLVNFLLARHSAVAHSAGEWARLWPLHHLVRLAGYYVIDREAHDSLYRLVLKRYVQMAIAQGIHLAIFPEGGLTRDGQFQPLSFGLLNYTASATWPGMDRDVVFIPVGFSYDQIPEQRQLVAGDERAFRARGRVYLALASIKFVFKFLWLFVTPRKNRLGWACASFGDPVSLKRWQRARGVDLKQLPSEQRREQIDALGRQLMDDVSDIIPVLPVQLLARAIEADPDASWNEAALFARAGELERALRTVGAPMFSYNLDSDEAYRQALRRLTRLGVVARGADDSITPVATERAMLQYYANTVVHYFEPSSRATAIEAHGVESSLTEQRNKNYLAAIAASYDRVQQVAVGDKPFLARFYQTFTDSSAVVADKFSDTDMARQQVHLQKSLRHMVDFFVDRKPSQRLQQIAGSHSHRGNDITAPLYDLWLDSLINTLREYDPEFDTEIELCWRAVMAPGIAFMRSRYADNAEDLPPPSDDTGSVTDEGIARWLEHWSARAPNKLALRSPDRDLSYAELDAEVSRLAAGLQHRLGVEAGDRVAFLGLNRVEFFCVLFACAKLGAILVPINFRLVADEQARLIDRVEPKALFVERQYAANARQLAHSCKQIWLDDQPPGIADFVYADLLKVPAPLRANHGRLDSPLLIVFTSGSTGDPKGAVLTQAAMHWNALNSRVMHDMTRVDHIVTVLPFFHVGGINIQSLPALQVGATVTIFAQFDPVHFVDFVQTERPTLTVLVPAQMQALMALPDWERTDMSSLRAVSTGSTIVNRELIRQWANKGIPVIQIYGCTESGPIAVHQTIEGISAGLGTVGHPALYTEVCIADQHGCPLGPGREGEVLLRGANLASHYWRDEAATAATFVDGWLHTGDLGQIDRNGRLSIVGRKKRLIISGGENIHPVELEQVLEQHPGVDEAAVIGIPDPKWDEVPVAVIARTSDRISEVDLRTHLDQNLGRYKHPRHIIFTDVLPRTALQKIAYPEVEELVKAKLSD